MTHHVSAQLHQLPVFAPLSRRALQHLDSLMTPVSFGFGDTLCREDRVGREAFVITSGTVAVSRGGELVATLGAGDIVGELALLGDGIRNATVTATSPVTARVMSAQEFASVVQVDGVGDEVRRLAAARAA
jgi:CRP-like cAMP-binding protein